MHKIIIIKCIAIITLIVFKLLLLTEEEIYFTEMTQLIAATMSVRNWFIFVCRRVTIGSTCALLVQ